VATSSSSPVWARFSPFQVDLAGGKLLRAGVRVPIQDQPMQVLRLLLEAEGGVVTREQLRTALWPEDTFVDFEHGVNTAVKKLRHALEDSAENPRFIETLPKIGYRFMAAVEWVSEANGHGLHRVVPIAPPGPTPVAESTSIGSKWKRKVSAIAIAVLAAAAAISLTNENSYLFRTQLGMSLRQAFATHRAEPQVALSQRRLTANPNDAPLTGGVISPDGKYLAYSDPTGLYLRQVDGGETFAVPLPAGFQALPDSWFPDSVHLAVRQLYEAKNKPSSLWTISVMGGVPRLLAEEGGHARVSPDGSRIVFLARQGGHHGIWLIDAATNTTRKIIDAGDDHLSPVAWAPDGKRFAYVRIGDHPTSQIEVYDLASARSEPILSNAALGGALEWVTATRLIYSLHEPSPNEDDFNLWRLPLNSGTGRPAGPPSRITNDRGWTANISATSDGKRIALVRRAFQADVYLADVETKGNRVGKPRRLTLDDRQDFPFAWTPDSKAILFLSDRQGPLRIFKQGIDQTQPELLVGGNERMWVPRLTPDGTAVLYLVNPMQGDPAVTSRIMRVGLAGGLSQFVLEAQGIYNHQCAQPPSNLCIYGQVDKQSQRFFSFDPLAGNSMEIAAAKMKLADVPSYNWSLSPDGRYVVTTKWIGPEKTFALRITELATGEARDLPVAGPTGEVTTDWAADGKSVWLGGVKRKGPWGHSGVLNVDLNGKVRTILDEPNLSLWAAIPSPDGRHLALVGHSENSNALLLESF